MKQKIFTLMILLALVVAGLNSYSQNARYTPTVGSRWTYTINGLTTATSAALTINGSTTVPTTDAGFLPAQQLGTGYSVQTASSFDDPNNRVTATYNWLAPGTYHIWVVVNNGTCTNQAFQQIVVTANNFDVELISLGLNTDPNFVAGWEDDGSIAGPVCPVYATGMNFDIDAPYSDGSSYVFFRVSKNGDNGGTWDFAITADGGTVEYYNETTTAWVTSSSRAEIPDAVTDVLIRITLENIPAGYSDFDASVLAVENHANGDFSDTTPGNDADDIIISAIPDMSGVTFE